LLANTIALIHALLMALVIGGALVATTPRVILRFPRWLVVAYLIALGLTLLSYLFFGDCLMTVWEKELRDQAAPGSAYGGSFLQRYFGFLPRSLTQPGHFAPWLGTILAVTVWAFLQLRRRSVNPDSASTSFPTSANEIASVVETAPDRIHDPACPYDPNDPIEVEQFWENAIVRRPAREDLGASTYPSPPPPEGPSS
jgi:hypothetical protein